MLNKLFFFGSLLCALTVQAQVSVLDYGAVPDGKTHCTAAFKKAVEASRDVYVPPGRFLVDRVALPERTYFHGAGDASVIILAKGTGVVEVGNFCKIANLYFTGEEKYSGVHEDNTSVALIQLGASHDILIGGIRMENYKNTGICSDHAADVRILNSHFEKLNVAMEFQFSSRVQVTGNRVVDIGRHGIQFWGNWKFENQGSEDFIFTDNYVKNGGGGAIWGCGTKRVVMTGNIVDGAEDVGLDLEWCSDSTITGNTVRNCENAGISLFYSCARVTIAGNTVINDRKIADPKAAWFVRAGIWLTDPNREKFKKDFGHRDVTIVGNTIYCTEGRRRAIWIGAESENITLAGNLLNGGECKGFQADPRDPLKVVKVK